MLSTAQRSFNGKKGAQVLHAKYNAAYLTAAARQRFLSRFLDQVDPHRTLPEPERLRRAAAARKAYFAQLARKSAQIRASRKEASQNEKPASVVQTETGQEVRDASARPD